MECDENGTSIAYLKGASDVEAAEAIPASPKTGEPARGAATSGPKKVKPSRDLRISTDG